MMMMIIVIVIRVDCIMGEAFGKLTPPTKEGEPFNMFVPQIPKHNYVGFGICGSVQVVRRWTETLHVGRGRTHWTRLEFKSYASPPGCSVR